MLFTDRLKKWRSSFVTDDREGGGASKAVLSNATGGWEPVSVAVNALAAAQGLGIAVYKTKADMLADKSRPTDSGAWVLIDPDPRANTSYLWNGHSWQPSFDRLTFALGNGSGFQQAGAHATLRAIQDKLREASLSPTDFFDPAIANGSMAADASLQAAIDRAAATGQQITIPAGHYKLTGNATFQIDLGKFSLVGQGNVTFDCSQFTGENVFQVFSSERYPQAAYQNTKHTFAGITLIGGKTRNRHGILVGHAKHAYNGQLNFQNVAIGCFDRNHHYTDNAWRIAWRSCTFIDALTRLALAPEGLRNAGEVILYDHCQFSDGEGDIEWACASWQVDMVGCSILNTTMYVTGQGVSVNVFGGNIENPNATAFYEYISISRDTCRVSLFGTRLTMNRPALFTDAPFKVAAHSVLQFFAVTWPDGAYRFKEKAGHQAFCSGDGIIIAEGSTYHPLSGGDKAALSAATNALRNGGFEEGSLVGWAIARSASNDGEASASTSSPPPDGQWFCRLASAKDGSISASQRIACRPGNLVVASAQARLVSPAGNGMHGALSLQFHDAQGHALPHQGFASNINESDSKWMTKGQSLMRQAPAGACHVEVSIQAQGGAVVDFDDVILNIG